jgi:hypothetical protein
MNSARTDEKAITVDDEKEGIIWSHCGPEVNISIEHRPFIDYLNLFHKSGIRFYS